jgi:fructokinase
MRIGIDLGGTKTEVVSLDGGGVERFRKRVATPKGDYDGTLAAICTLVGDAEQAAGSGSVGIGIPGAISPATGRVKNANSTWLNGRPLMEDLTARLQRPIRIANDANCLALSEALDGAAAGAQVVFGVILGTGTGGGIVAGGRLIVGVNAVAGEWGHNPLPWPEEDERPGPPCYCGRHGCIETFLSGPGLSRDYKDATGNSLDAPAIVQRAEAGEENAVAALVRYEQRLARALATVINLLDPDLMVVGGGLSRIDRLYTRVPAMWQEYVFSDAVATRLVPARHGDSSGVRGAARLWDQS